MQLEHWNILGERKYDLEQRWTYLYDVLFFCLTILYVMMRSSLLDKNFEFINDVSSSFHANSKQSKGMLLFFLIFWLSEEKKRKREKYK